MSLGGPLSRRCLILTPTGRDAEVASKLLSEAQLPALAVKDLLTLKSELERGAGFALIANEVLQTSDLRPVAEFLETQPAWSDFPFIILTARGGGPERNPAAARIADVLGNVTFLERPFHPTTFLSVVKTSMRGRTRQYEARARQLDLIEGERQLQTALIAGEMGSWHLNVSDGTLVASDKCKSHFGRGPRQPFSYEDLLSSVHPDDVERMSKAVTRTLETGEDYIIEYQNIWEDGSVHWVDVRARAIRNGNGVIDKLVGVSSNITSRKLADLERERLLSRLADERAALTKLTGELEERVRERTSQLLAETANREKAQEQLFQSQKLESIGKLTGGVAHDFNNLLSAVVGNLDLLKKRVPNDPRVLRLIDGAMQGAQRGASLTQRMLAFARQQDLKTASVDVTLLLVGLKDLIERSLGSTFELAVRTIGDPPPIEIDAAQVELAILNLAINARDAMPNGGVITIEAAQVSSKQDEADFVVIRVRDTGAGMDGETLKKATEPFFSTKPLGKGTGLGLSMVHGLAVQLGGRLALTSTIGSGTTAELWLPIARRPADQQLTEIKSSGTSTKRVKILLVDDDPLISMSTTEMLEDLGHTVIEASFGRRALEIIEEGQALDLLITDQAMPGMTGIQLAEHVKALRPELPILLATGYTDLPAGQQSELPRLGKPFRQIDLKEKVDALV